jgi:hypothetical protein
MIKNWNMNEVRAELNKIYWACTDPRMDGFVTWPCKQDLYRVKFMIDDMLSKCPSYSVEAEWLREQEAERIVEILKK